jgi:TPR repeat protein
MVQYVEDRSCTTQFELGQMYHLTDQRARDYEQAVKWYSHSAKRGYRRAQHRLGAMYAKGQGVSRNYVKAYAWCKVAAAQQSRHAIRKLARIETYLSSTQIIDARRLARQYYQMYVVPFK